MRGIRNLDLSRYDYAYEVLEASAPAPALVFDIGCGDGRMRRVEELGLRWLGFDRTAWSKAQKWDLNEPCPIEEKAGAVLLLDVLEHCVSPGLALQNISAAMAPGGILILTMPNPRWSASRLYSFMTGYASSFTPGDIEVNHHLFPIWPHVAECLLGYAGLEVEDYVTLDGRTRPRLSRLPADLVRLAVEAVDPTSRGMSYGLVARKAG